MNFKIFCNKAHIKEGPTKGFRGLIGAPEFVGDAIISIPENETMKKTKIWPHILYVDGPQRG